MIIKNSQAVRALFRSKKLPVTHQRLAIFEALRSSKEHPGAELLYQQLKPSYPTLSLATVYKTLQALHGRGLISLVNSPAAQARYDFITEVHHHLICVRCGRIADLFDKKLDALKPPRIPDFEVSDHSVHFRGLCKACRSQNRGRKRNV
jgi:Fur family peroxide stress response transcriptional regulator